MKEDLLSGARLEKITLVAPTPPPFAGPEISTQHLLDSPLAEQFQLIHIRSNLKATNTEKGAFSLGALLRQIHIYYRIVISRLRGSRCLYALLAMNLLGFVKDAGTVLLGKLLGMRVVAHMKGASMPAFYNHARPPLKWLIRFTLRRADAIIVQALPIRGEIATTFGIDEKRLPVVPNMVEMPPPCPQPSRNKPSTELLFVGHLSVGKGFYDLVSVLADLLTDHPEASFTCVGEPKPRDRDYIARWLDMSPVTRQQQIQVDRVLQGEMPQMRYLGLVAGEDKHRIFCNSDIFVLPSYSESFPMSLLEAMSYGCAVVASPVGAVPEFVDHEQDGLLVPAGDTQGLAAALARLLGDPELRWRLGQSARARVEEHFTVEKVAPQYAQVLGVSHRAQQSSPVA